MLKNIIFVVIRFFICWISSSVIIITINFFSGRIKYFYKNTNKWPNQTWDSWGLEAKNWFIYFFIITLIYFIIYYIIPQEKRNMKKLIITSGFVAILPFMFFGLPYSFYSINSAFKTFFLALLLFGFVGGLLPMIDKLFVNFLKFLKNKFCTFCFILVLFSLNSYSQINTSSYFKLNENQVIDFKGFFVKDKKDNNYKKMEDIYGKLFKSDTLIDLNEIVYKTVIIDGYKAFYTLKAKDTNTINPTIGANYFIDCAMLFRNDTMFIASAYYKDDLKKISLKNFNNCIPPILKRTDSINYYWKSKKTTLTDFHKSNIKIENKRFKNCLKIKIIEDYQETIHYSYVWLSKKFGLIKWIRATGRVDTRIF